MEIIHSDIYRFVNLTVLDLIGAFVLIALIFVFAHTYAKRKKETVIPYRYFTLGLMVRIFGVIGFCLVYLIFYQGDTLDYFNSTASLNHLLFSDPKHYFTIMFDGSKPDYYYYFNSSTGFPEWHIWKDPLSYIVVRLISPVCLLGFNSFLLSSIIMACITYAGLWKLYRLLCTLYPNFYKYFAFSVLMVPSVIFWGSGLLKDSITLSAAAWLTYCIFSIFFMRRKLVANIFVLLIMTFLLLKIKPYIFVSLIPGLLIWLMIKWALRIKNTIFRILVIPTAVILALAGAALIISSMGKSLGVYSDVDTIIQKVKTTQEDLVRSEQYGQNNFNIGKIEGTPLGLIVKAPFAILAGLFRPMIWEAGNPFIFLSALENLFLLILLIYTLIKLGPVKYIRTIIRDPFLTFALIFTLMFAFGVGLASANFGALVRYKIPLLPFFVSGMFIMLGVYRQQKKELSGPEENTGV